MISSPSTSNKLVRLSHNLSLQALFRHCNIKSNYYNTRNLLPSRPLFLYQFPASSFSSSTTANMSPTEKPTLPADYKVPDVWKYDKERMEPVHGSNRPTSGAQTTKELPRGNHDIQLYGLATPSKFVCVSFMLSPCFEKPRRK